VFTALQRLRIPSQFLYLTEENHWVLKDANGIKWYDHGLNALVLAFYFFLIFPIAVFVAFFQFQSFFSVIAFVRTHCQVPYRSRLAGKVVLRYALCLPIQDCSNFSIFYNLRISIARYLMQKKMHS
jgi:hypothetical protein